MCWLKKLGTRIGSQTWLAGKSLGPKWRFVQGGIIELNREFPGKPYLMTSEGTIFQNCKPTPLTNQESMKSSTRLSWIKGSCKWELWITAKHEQKLARSRTAQHQPVQVCFLHHFGVFWSRSWVCSPKSNENFHDSRFQGKVSAEIFKVYTLNLRFPGNVSTERERWMLHHELKFRVLWGAPDFEAI